MPGGATDAKGIGEGVHVGPDEVAAGCEDGGEVGYDDKEHVGFHEGECVADVDEVEFGEVGGGEG